jgi:hypothetical protein
MVRRIVLAGALVFAFGACGDTEVPPPQPPPGPQEKPKPVCDEAVGNICTWAGTGDAAFDGDGHNLWNTDFYWPIDMTFVTPNDVYILDWNNHKVRHLEANGTLKTVIGTDFVGDGPPAQADLREPGAPGTTIDLNHPTQLLALPDGKLLLVAWHNHKLRRYDPATGNVLVTIGRGADFKGDGGPASAALLNQPVSVALGADGSQYILDQRNQVIRKIDPAGMISTVAGTPKMMGFEGDGGPPLMAKMKQPTGSNPPPGGTLAMDDQGRLYFSDMLNHRIRRVDFAANTIETVAGNGTAGFGGDGGPATQAMLNTPRKINFGPDGRLYVGDTQNHRIRAIDLATGTITTVAGTGTPGYDGDNKPAVDAQLNRPNGVSFSEGFMYILDTDNNRIRRVKM